MKSLNDAWNNFVNKHPKAAKWVREGGLFFIFSNLVTIIQYIIYAFLPNLLGLELAGIEWSWPAIPVSLFGIDFTWNAIGYDVVYDIAGNVVIGGGLGYLIAIRTGCFPSITSQISAFQPRVSIRNALLCKAARSVAVALESATVTSVSPCKILLSAL